jgi:hypothetical protein
MTVLVMHRSVEQLLERERQAVQQLNQPQSAVIRGLHAPPEGVRFRPDGAMSLFMLVFSDQTRK